jgi:hypothetical protein
MNQRKRIEETYRRLHVHQGDCSSRHFDTCDCDLSFALEAIFSTEMKQAIERLPERAESLSPLF